MLKSLKTQIVLTSSLCLAAGVLAITLTNYFTARQHAYQGLAEQNLALARSHAKAIAEWVQSKQSLVQAAVNDAEPSKSLLMLRDAGQFASTYFDYVNAYAPPAPGAGQAPARPGQEEALRTGRPVVTSPSLPPGGGAPVITFAAPVGPEGAVTSVGAADASMDAVLANVASIRPTASSEAFLVDAEGTVVAHSQADRLLKPATEISADLAPDALRQAAARSAWVPVRVGGQKYLLMVVPVEGMPWMLAVLLHEAQALAPITAVLTASIAASALVLLVTAVLLGGFIAHRLARLGQLRDAMREVASGAGAADSGGDLARRMDTRGDDELAEIAASFNTFADRQAVVLARIHEASTCVRLAAREIAAGNLDLSHRTEETVAGLTGMSASMQQLTDAVQGNAAATHQANQLASQASQVAQRGGEVVGRAVQTMDEISAASRKIADIIGVIDSIAFQTNILALNAAVEAARAGEQGRGFAVVAAEVRQLAQRSAHAAHEIRTLISSSVERVQDGAQLVHSAGRTIEEIVGAVREVVSVMGRIHASTVAQSEGIAAMGQSVLRLEGLAQQNAALVEQSAASAATLEDQSAALAGVMGRSLVRA